MMTDKDVHILIKTLQEYAEEICNLRVQINTTEMMYKIPGAHKSINVAKLMADKHTLLMLQNEQMQLLEKNGIILD